MKGGVVNTKVHCWETPSLPRRRKKDGGKVKEGAEGNGGRRKGGGKCNNEGRRQQAEFEINYNSGKGTFFFFNMSLSDISPHCLHLCCPCCPPPFVAFSSLLDLATILLVFWVDLVSPSGELWCSPPPFRSLTLVSVNSRLYCHHWTSLLLDFTIVGPGHC